MQTGSTLLLSDRLNPKIWTSYFFCISSSIVPGPFPSSSCCHDPPTYPPAWRIIFFLFNPHAIILISIGSLRLKISFRCSWSRVQRLVNRSSSLAVQAYGATVAPRVSLYICGLPFQSNIPRKCADAVLKGFHGVRTHINIVLSLDSYATRERGNDTALKTYSN